MDSYGYSYSMPISAPNALPLSHPMPGPPRPYPFKDCSRPLSVVVPKSLGAALPHSSQPLLRPVTGVTTPPSQSLKSLIFCEILASPNVCMTTREISRALQQKYPYFLRRNNFAKSVGHSLSLNKCFVKLGKSDSRCFNWTLSRGCFLNGDPHAEPNRPTVRRRRAPESKKSRPADFPPNVVVSETIQSDFPTVRNIQLRSLESLDPAESSASPHPSAQQFTPQLPVSCVQ